MKGLHHYICKYIKTYCELWEEDDWGVCPCDGRTLTHAGLPLQRDASDKRTVDPSSAPVERKVKNQKLLREEDEECLEKYLCIS